MLMPVAAFGEQGECPDDHRLAREQFFRAGREQLMQQCPGDDVQWRIAAEGALPGVVLAPPS
jgi:hypothetical protein